jgi:hypothetical protein
MFSEDSVSSAWVQTGYQWDLGQLWYFLEDLVSLNYPKDLVIVQVHPLANSMQALVEHW